jgi:hypothetical protein
VSRVMWLLGCRHLDVQRARQLAMDPGRLRGMGQAATFS